MSNFCGTMIFIFITTKLSSDLTVGVRINCGDPSVKAPQRIIESSQQDFNFVVKLQKIMIPNEETPNWLVD